MSGIGYLAVGYGFVWVLLAAYLFWLGHRTTVLQRRLKEVESHGETPAEAAE